MKRFVVLGGCGVIGRVVVRDLLASRTADRVVIADFNETAAKALVKELGSKRASSAFADATRPAILAKVLKGSDVVVNCTQHDFNLRVMEAARKARVHYVDLGGLFHWTLEQLKLDGAMRRAGVTAILGGGCAPGITNVLTRFAADQLASVESVRIRVGTVDFAEKPAGFVFPYSAQTIVEEMTLTPWVFRGGRYQEIKPRSRWEQVDFPEPVGRQWTVCTRHSEVATIPLSFHRKGLRVCDFCVSFDRAFVKELVRRMNRGETVKDFQKLPAPRGKPDDAEISRVVVVGSVGPSPREGRVTITVDCHAKARRAWHASAGDIDTGCPPSIIAGMLADGLIDERGVLAPERAVPVEPFIRALKKRGMRVTMSIQPA